MCVQTHKWTGTLGTYNKHTDVNFGTRGLKSIQTGPGLCIFTNTHGQEMHTDDRGTCGCTQTWTWARVPRHADQLVRDTCPPRLPQTQAEAFSGPFGPTAIPPCLPGRHPHSLTLSNCPDSPCPCSWFSVPYHSPKVPLSSWILSPFISPILISLCPATNLSLFLLGCISLLGALSPAIFTSTFVFSPFSHPVSLSVSLCLSDSFISACRCPYDCLFPCISFSISVLVSFSQQLHLFASMSSIPLVIVPHLKAPASDPTSSKLSASISMPFACQHVVCMPACCLHGFFCVTICMMVFVGLS